MKILVIRLSSFGDQIHLCPAISDLKRRRSDIKIYWVVQSEFATVPLAHKDVTRVFLLPLMNLRRSPLKFSLWRDFFRIVKQLRKEHFEIAIDAQGVIKSAVVALLSGARERVGFDRQGIAEPLAYWFYHRHFDYEPGMTSVTKLRQYFSWVFGLAPPEGEPKFGLLSLKQSRQSSENLLLFVPFASNASKMLDSNSWIILADSIQKNSPTTKIHMSWGSAHERKIAHDFLRLSSGKISPNPRRLESSELIDTLMGYSIVVGVDTGITHLANALGIPTVMIFKKSAPQLFYTAGSPYSIQIGSANEGPTQYELEEKVLKLLRQIPELYP